MALSAASREAVAFRKYESAAFLKACTSLAALAGCALLVAFIAFPRDGFLVATMIQIRLCDKMPRNAGTDVRLYGRLGRFASHRRVTSTLWQKD